MGDDRRDDLPRMPEGSEDDFARALLASLHDDRPEAPDALPDRTIRKVQAALTGRDLIDLTTFVFLMRFCAPFLDLLASFFGQDPFAASTDRSESRPNHRSDRDE